MTPLKVLLMALSTERSVHSSNKCQFGLPFGVKKAKFRVRSCSLQLADLEESSPRRSVQWHLLSEFYWKAGGRLTAKQPKTIS